MFPNLEILSYSCNYPLTDLRQCPPSLNKNQKRRNETKRLSQKISVKAKGRCTDETFTVAGTSYASAPVHCCSLAAMLSGPVTLSWIVRHRRAADGNERIEGTHGHVKYTSTFRLLSGRLSRGCCRSRGNCLCPRDRPNRSMLNETYDCSQFGIRTLRRWILTWLSWSYLCIQRKSPSRNCRGYYVAENLR